MAQLSQFMDAALQDSLKNCLMFLVIDPMDHSVIQWWSYLYFLSTASKASFPRFSWVKAKSTIYKHL